MGLSERGEGREEREGRVPTGLIRTFWDRIALTAYLLVIKCSSVLYYINHGLCGVCCTRIKLIIYDLLIYNKLKLIYYGMPEWSVGRSVSLSLSLSLSLSPLTLTHLLNSSSILS